MYHAILLTHQIVVSLFLAIYFIKTILLLSNKEEALMKISKGLKIPEMIVSVLFLATGIYLFTKLPGVNMLMIIKLGLVVLSIPVAIIGFKKRNKLLASLSFFMLIASYGIAEVHGKRMGVVSDNSANADNFVAKNYYNENCAKCHGDDGKAMMMGALDLSVSQLGHDEAVTVVMNGRGTMPANPGLSKEQADAIASYVETLRGK